MAKLVRASMRRLLAATALAAVFSAAAIVHPPATCDAWGPSIAVAKEGNNGGGNNGGGNNGGGNNGGGNNGGGNNGGGNNGGGDNGGGEDDDGGGDDDGGDDHGGDDHGGDDEEPGAGEDPSDDTHVDEETGAAVEVEGADIEVTYPDGWKEELQDGWFELKDPAGRTVVERRATRKDIRRLWILAR